MSCSISEYVPRVDSPEISGVHKIPICQNPAAVSALATRDAASKGVSSGIAAPLTGDTRGSSRAYSGGPPGPSRPAVSQRVRQKERTRAALIAAARQLILDGAGITMMGTATAVRVSEATAYRHFPDLPSLLREAFTGLWPDTPGDLARAGDYGDVPGRPTPAPGAALTQPPGTGVPAGTSVAWKIGNCSAGGAALSGGRELVWRGLRITDVASRAPGRAWT